MASEEIRKKPNELGIGGRCILQAVGKYKQPTHQDQGPLLSESSPRPYLFGVKPESL